jgi:hypothetical protein
MDIYGYLWVFMGHGPESPGFVWLAAVQLPSNQMERA